MLIFAPTSTDKRMAELDKNGAGFIYCVARRGVTGRQSEFGDDFADYLARCRAATSLRPVQWPRSPEKKGIGSQTIRLVDEQGAAAVGPFIAGLR